MRVDRNRRMSRAVSVRAACVVAAALVAGCHRSPTYEPAPGADAQGHTAASATTAAHNAEVAASLPLADQQDFADARRGLVAGDGDVVITRADGSTAWDTTAYAFEQGKRRRAPIPASGGRRRSTTSTGSSRSPTASTRCAATTSPT